jgi:hypothetical protein
LTLCTYLNKFGLQRIIQDNKSKEAKYGVPENCITGILENSEQLQAIIKKDWKKYLRFGIQVNSLIVI